MSHPKSVQMMPHSDASIGCMSLLLLVLRAWWPDKQGIFNGLIDTDPVNNGCWAMVQKLNACIGIRLLMFCRQPRRIWKLCRSWLLHSQACSNRSSICSSSWPALRPLMLHCSSRWCPVRGSRRSRLAERHECTTASPAATPPAVFAASQPCMWHMMPSHCLKRPAAAVAASAAAPELPSCF